MIVCAQMDLAPLQQRRAAADNDVRSKSLTQTSSPEKQSDAIIIIVPLPLNP